MAAAYRPSQGLSKRLSRCTTNPRAGLKPPLGQDGMAGPTNCATAPHAGKRTKCTNMFMSKGLCPLLSNRSLVFDKSSVFVPDPRNGPERNGATNSQKPCHIYGSKSGQDIADRPQPKLDPKRPNIVRLRRWQPNFCQFGKPGLWRGFDQIVDGFRPILSDSAKFERCQPNSGRARPTLGCVFDQIPCTQACRRDADQFRADSIKVERIQPKSGPRSTMFKGMVLTIVRKSLINFGPRSTNCRMRL